MKEALYATHKVRFYGVPCWMNDETDDLWGVNWLADKLIPIVSGIHNLIVMLVPGAGERGFPFVVVEEYKPARRVL